jgi:hypothetical protein
MRHNLYMRNVETSVSYIASIICAYCVSCIRHSALPPIQFLLGDEHEDPVVACVEYQRGGVDSTVAAQKATVAWINTQAQTAELSALFTADGHRIAKSMQVPLSTLTFMPWAYAPTEGANIYPSPVAKRSGSISQPSAATGSATETAAGTDNGTVAGTTTASGSGNATASVTKRPLKTKSAPAAALASGVLGSFTAAADSPVMRQWKVAAAMVGELVDAPQVRRTTDFATERDVQCGNRGHHNQNRELLSYLAIHPLKRNKLEY